MSDQLTNNAPIPAKDDLAQSVAEKYGFKPRPITSSPKPIAPAPKPVPPASKPIIKTSQEANPTRLQRLYKKFKQNPHAFFRDSKNPLIQAFAIFYRASK